MELIGVTFSFTFEKLDKRDNTPAPHNNRMKFINHEDFIVLTRKIDDYKTKNVEKSLSFRGINWNIKGVFFSHLFSFLVRILSDIQMGKESESGVENCEWAFICVFCVRVQ